MSTTPTRISGAALWQWIFAGLLSAAILLLGVLLWRANTPPPPDPRLIDVSVRSTVFALPTQTPYVVVATQVVEVTRVVQVTVVATPTPLATATPEASAPLLLAPVALSAPAESALPPADAIVVAAAPEAAPVDQAPAPPPSCPASSGRGYDSIPVDSAPISHPDSIHGDLNLAQRGWQQVDAALEVTEIDGPADSDPPQLATIFPGTRLPAFSSAFQIYDWNWGCAAHGCRGDLLTHREVLLLGMVTNPGEELTIPNRGAQIYGGGYKALVLYAEPNRITLGYTREDSVANGYTVHLENLCVDPNLLALYHNNSAAGRGQLPALRDDEVLGTAGLGEIRVAVRDRGVFLDPRSRKDWWRGY